MDCPDCGEELYSIQGYRLDRDGIRNCQWCATCKVIFSSHASNLSKAFVMKDAYEGDAKSRIRSHLERALSEL